MLKPLRKCKYPGCRMVASEGWCPAHKPKVNRKESAAWHYLYTDPRYHWAERRTAQLLAEPFCRECSKRGDRVRAEDADHIVPHRGDVNLFTKGDLQSLCHRCHSRKTMAEMNARTSAKRV